MCKKGIVKILDGLKKSKSLEPYIQHIRFPNYRNLEEGLKITFDFPLTAIVGQNGTNKSSVLRALGCCPKQFSLSAFWFETKLDPIDQDGNRSRYIYQYYNRDAKCDVEVIQSRIKRAYAGKDKEKGLLNPDYWETSRPILSDGMKRMPAAQGGKPNKTRWSPVDKGVVFLDFRSEISAYDKFFYHGDLTQTLRHNSRQSFIRSKSKILKDAIDKDLKSKKMYRNQKEHIKSNTELPENQVKIISKILGREYSSIKIIEHLFFKKQGCSVILESKNLKYSEAFAGSGEFSVVILVQKTMSAKEKSLIILDEPEVSLHPGAQEHLVDFLLDQIKLRKHQIVIGTHSPFILKKLPSYAIKTMHLDPLNNKVKATDETLPEEAFFHLGITLQEKKTIFVEDRLAAEVALKALKLLGQGVHDSFNVVHLPGGSSTLLQNYLVAFAISERKDLLFLMDGDQRPKQTYIDAESYIGMTNTDIESKLHDTLKSIPKIPIDAGDETTNDQKDLQTRELRIKVLGFCEKYLHYLPDEIPEEFIWKNTTRGVPTEIDDALIKEKCYKEKFRMLTHYQLGKASFEEVSSDEIFNIQKQCLALVDKEMLGGVVAVISNFLTRQND